MSETRVISTHRQVEELASKLVNELHKIPPYDNGAKQRLVGEYLKKVEFTLLDKISNLSADEQVSAISRAFAELLADEC